MADLGCDYDDDPNSIMAYEAGIADGIAEERARWEALTWNIDAVRVEGLRIVDLGKGMRRAAKYAARHWRLAAIHFDRSAARARVPSEKLRLRDSVLRVCKARDKCRLIAEGKPAFATPRAFGSARGQ